MFYQILDFDLSHADLPDSVLPGSISLHLPCLIGLIMFDRSQHPHYGAREKVTFYIPSVLPGVR
jgi:hypothetical protein